MGSCNFSKQTLLFVPRLLLLATLDYMGMTVLIEVKNNVFYSYFSFFSSRAVRSVLPSIKHNGRYLHFIPKDLSRIAISQWK